MNDQTLVRELIIIRDISDKSEKLHRRAEQVMKEWHALQADDKRRRIDELRKIVREMESRLTDIETATYR